MTKFVSQIHSELLDFGVEVLVDDRDERPGVKFNDADLLGIPYRMNIGKRSFAKGEVELICRKTFEKKLVSVKEHSFLLLREKFWKHEIKKPNYLCIGFRRP